MSRARFWRKDSRLALAAGLGTALVGLTIALGG